MEILYVDDEKDKREQTKMFLEKENDDFIVDTASSVEQGMEKLKKNGYENKFPVNAFLFFHYNVHILEL